MDQNCLVNGHDEANMHTVLTSQPHTNISNNSDVVMNGIDIVITGDEVMSPRKNMVKSPSQDLLLSPIKPASGETLNLTDAILISPRRVSFYV